MSRDPRDWQADMNIAQQLESWKIDPGGVEDGAAFYTIEKDGIQTIIHADNMLEVDVELLGSSIQALPYWLQQAKTLKEDNARWICKHTGAEQKYLKQSNDIAELRGRAEKAEALTEVARNESLEWQNVAVQYRLEQNTLKELNRQAEEREQKLKEAINDALKWTWYHGEANMEAIEEGLNEVMETLYPLDREEEHD